MEPIITERERINDELISVDNEIKKTNKDISGIYQEISSLCPSARDKYGDGMGGWIINQYRNRDMLIQRRKEIKATILRNGWEEPINIGDVVVICSSVQGTIINKNNRFKIGEMTPKYYKISFTDGVLLFDKETKLARGYTDIWIRRIYKRDHPVMPEIGGKNGT